MLKNKEIIEKLSKEQKIALVTDTHDGYGSALDQYKIPRTSLADLWEENEKEGGEPIFPSAKSLANSWDEALFGGVGKGLASIGAGHGDNLFVLPTSNAASSVYGSELSEEPQLSGGLVAGMAKRLKEAGVPFCVKEPVCTMDDARFLDKEADFGVVYDRYARPFKLVHSVGGACAMLRSNEEVSDSYKEANEKIYNEFIPSNLNKIVEIKDSDATAVSLVQGNQLIGGSSLVLATALENYERIYRSMEEGGATAHELNTTLMDGAAVSEEMIDEALDRKIELAKKCDGIFTRVSSADMENYAYQAALRSVVLVKNSNKALPLRKNEKMCLCGDVISDGENSNYLNFIDKVTEGIKGFGGKVLGFERGYDIKESVSKELIEPACVKAAAVGTTIAFVGLGVTREAELEQNPRLSLPGNQIAMLTNLRKVSKKLIVVICGEKLPDMSFDVMADAILLAPSRGSCVAKALANILGGSASPSGRLAYAGYSNVDAIVREHQKRKSTGKQKIGPFVGYRYVDSNGEWSKYPIGFGLSYTNFEYSKLSVDRQGNVTVTVKNTGKIAGREVVQVYVAVPNSTRIRPRKELKGFASVGLKPGEKKTVNINLGGFDIYDAARDKTVIEAGYYDIHVGPSAGRILLSRRINLIGASLEKEEKRLSDYLQNVSNIVSESYTMEAYCKPMNTKSRLKSFGVILLLATLFADVVYVISCLMYNLPIWDGLYLTIWLAANGACLICSFISIGVGGAASKRAKRIVEKQEMEATRELFKTVKPVDVSSIDQLFADEFDMALEASSKKEVVLDERDDSTFTYMAVDTDIPTLCKELIAHFAEYGLVITPKMARRLLSSVMTSRLLVVRNAFGISCDRIVEILARFFGTASHTENLGGAKWERKSMLRYNDQAAFDKGGRTAPLMQAVNAASTEGDKACFYGVDGVRYEDLGNMLMPYVQYFGNPDIEHKIVDGGETITMPSNLWFVVAPAEGQSVDDLPAFVANLAAVVDLEGQSTPESANKATRKHITCRQIDALIFRAKKSADIDENVWKGVDSLEAFVREKTPFHIGNKLFLQLERYLAVYAACEEDMHEGMDCAVASKLIPGILNLLKGNEGMADVDLAQIVESIFGEEYSIVSCNLIKRLVLSRESINVAEPVKEEAVSEAPVEPVQEAPASETSVDPVQEAPANEAPVEPAKEEAVSEAPVESAQEASVSEAPVEPTQETPVSEAPAEEVQKAPEAKAATKAKRRKEKENDAD